MDAEIIRNIFKCNLLDEEFDWRRRIWLMVWWHGLKDEFYTKDVAFKLASSFRECEVVEMRKDRSGSKFFRIRPWVNVTKPIRRMVKFLVESSVRAGCLAYERLPHICFKCSFLGHFVRQCPDLPEGADPRRDHTYDLWIRVLVEKFVEN
ncbi:hypothetical protein LIER_22474 [Lithospermum erythrorhizon]|uniref:CCHC-type domain-containing protein n=1 Tax=Lithospermum erythrorhizon TaxID=34254 RepID=A0AAV3QWC1_LITER